MQSLAKGLLPLLLTDTLNLHLHVIAKEFIGAMDEHQKYMSSYM